MAKLRQVSERVDNERVMRNGDVAQLIAAALAHKIIVDGR